MQYHAPTKGFVVEMDALAGAAFDLKWAIQQIRKQACLPFEPHKTEGAMGAPQHAEQAILDAARRLGIDLGAQRHGQLDVRDAP